MATTEASRQKPGPKPKDKRLVRVTIFGRVRPETKEFLEGMPGADNVGRAVDMIVDLHRQVSTTSRIRKRHV